MLRRRWLRDVGRIPQSSKAQHYDGIQISHQKPNIAATPNKFDPGMHEDLSLPQRATFGNVPAELVPYAVVSFANFLMLSHVS